MTQESGKPEDEKAENEISDAPEVEAEVVDQDDADVSSSTAFDETSPEIDEALAGAEEALTPKKSTLTPGVILFFAFTAVALIAFFIWWRQSGDEAHQSENTVEEAAPQIEPGEPAPDDEGSAEEAPGEGPSPSLPTPSGKVENQPTEDLKPPAETASPDEAFLPPVSERGANKIANTIEAGALEAARRVQEADDTAAGTQDQQTDDIRQFDVTPEESEGSQLEASETIPDDTASREPEPAPQQAEKDSGGSAERTAEQPVAAEIPSKILNDLEALRSETARLESALSAERRRNADLAAEIAELRRDFETALAARDERYATEIADMKASLQKIQNSEVKGATDQLRANLALNALRRKVETGAPFAGELTAMAEFAPETASALTPYAHTGVPTNAELRESFGDAARKGLAAAGREEAGDGWGGVFARAKNLVSVRPATPQAGDSPKAVISRAEQAVGEGDLTYALSELDTLPTSAKDAMAGWISDAQARGNAQLALNALSQRLNGGGSE